MATHVDRMAGRLHDSFGRLTVDVESDEEDDEQPSTTAPKQNKSDNVVHLNRVGITVGSVVATLPSRPCKFYVDITCEKAEDVKFVAFRNMYCAYITVKVRLEGSDLRWYEAIPKHVLMAGGYTVAPLF